MKDMEKIKIRNCNNIVEAEIKIMPTALNIKYGFNGTGKSTISKAISCRASGNDKELELLKPYITQNEDDVPTVDEMPFHNVKVFNEDYVRDYVFKTDDIFEDSFRVFLKSEECDNLAKQISDLLSDLQNTVIDDASINDLLTLLDQYVTTVNFADGNISKRGGMGEFIKGNGGGFDKHEELQSYQVFYSGKKILDVSNWANWRTKGIEHMNGATCPFCAGTFDVLTIQKQNNTIKAVFKNSAIKTAGAISEYLKTGISKGFIIPGSDEKLEKYMGDSGKTEEICSVLGKLAVETDYLIEKLRKVVEFRPMNVSHEELTNIEDKLRFMEISMDEVSEFYCTSSMETLASLINERVRTLLLNTGKLKGLFIKHEEKLEKLIKDRKEDINYFFTLAGFSYEFEIKKNGENKANAYLTPIGVDTTVTDPKKHLSWGEKNAFSLVMFMFYAISENADLIVLDDPISSFDINKKFAVIKRMFDNHSVTFKGKTVLMLTHDLQPVIDYVHGSFFKSDNILVYATYIENEKGVIHEHEINGQDLLNVVNMTRELAISSKQPIHVRIVNIRKYIELTTINYAESDIYNVLSNLVHGRQIPVYKDETQLPTDVIKRGIQGIKEFNIELTYDDIVNEISTANLMKEISGGGIYKRIIAVRLIFERGNNLLTKLRREHPGACKFLNETNHIENDYVFQLDPSKFFSMPEIYSDEIHDFLNKHIAELG